MPGLHSSNLLYEFPVAAAMNYHKLGGFKPQEFYFLMVLEAASPKSRCQQGLLKL